MSNFLSLYKLDFLKKHFYLFLFGQIQLIWPGLIRIYVAVIFDSPGGIPSEWSNSQCGGWQLAPPQWTTHSLGHFIPQCQPPRWGVLGIPQVRQNPHLQISFLCASQNLRKARRLEKNWDSFSLEIVCPSHQPVESNHSN